MSSSRSLFPDTAMGKLIETLLTVINDGDDKALRTFVLHHFAAKVQKRDTPERLTQMLTSIYQRAGRLEFTHLAQITTSEVAVFTRRLIGDGEVIFILEILPDQPERINHYRIDVFGPVFSRRFLPEITSSLPEAECLALIEQAAADAVRDEIFSGALLVAKHDTVLLKRAYGEANKEHGVPNSVQTKFLLASIGKMFTSVAVAQLAQRGFVSYDEPISRYLDDYPVPAIAQRITLHHLLTHTSGLSDFFGPKYDEIKLQLHHLRDYYPLFAEKPLLSEPGQTCSYSNAGFIVAGMIIERVTGQDFFAYVREQVFEPAGMHNTGYWSIDEVVPGRANGYIRYDPFDPLNPTPAWTNNVLVWGRTPGSPAGNCYSTVEDLLRFSRALMADRLLNSTFTNLITTGKVPLGNGTYGYGFHNGLAHGHRYIGHNGGGPNVGVSTNLSIFPDDGYTMVTLSNYSSPVAERFSEQACELVAKAMEIISS
jgi:CubicO group peptidase (beta-lactamase class C family)